MTTVPVMAQRRVFLSYARQDDEPFVARLASALEQEGVLVWFDRRSMPSRTLTFLDEIRRAIDGVDRVVAVMGPAALASDYVRCEWQYALTRDKLVVPILRLGDYTLPAELRNLHCPDVRATRPWRDAFAEILRVLNEPLPVLGEAVGLPSLPPHFRPRPEVLSRLAATVLLDLKKPLNPERWQRVTILTGMGGAGKSVLASAVARSIETRRAFCDGIFWLDLRRITGAQGAIELLSQLMASRGSLAGVSLAGPPEQRLAGLLQGRRCLLILDNVENFEPLESIVRCADASTRVLVSTRVRDLVDEAHRVPLAGLEDAEARHQLADWLQLSPQAFDADCELILQMCDGLPFAIALCGALIAGGISRAAVAAKLRAMDLGALQRRFPDYDYPGLLRCLEVSFESVAEASQQAIACLERMVIFAPGAQVPASTVFRLWRQSCGIDEASCSFELARLANHSLVRTETDQGSVSLHHLIHAYLSQRVTDPRAFHEELLAAYARDASADWVRGPDDHYYYENLVHHLVAARGGEPVCDLLVGSPAWMREKLRLEGNLLSYLVDVERALAALEDSPSNLLAIARLATARHLSRQGPRSFGEGVLKALVHLGEAERALELARANVDSPSRLGQMLEIYETLNDKDQDRPNLLHEVERWLHREESPRFLDAVRSKLVSLHARRGRLDDALRLWGELSEQGRKDSPWLPTVLARHLAEAGRLSDARTVDPNAAAAEEPRPDERDDREPVDFEADSAALAMEEGIERDVALIQLIHRLVNAREFTRAQAIALALARPESRMSSLAGIPWKPCLQEALKIARTLHGATRANGLMHVADTLSRLAESDKPAGLGGKICQWLRRQSETGHPETPAKLMLEAEYEIVALESTQRSMAFRFLALHNLSRAQGQTSRLLKAALEAANEIDEPQRKAREWAEIASSMVQADPKPVSLHEARGLLEKAMALAETSSNPKNVMRSRSALALILARNNRFDLALAIVEQIPDGDERQKAFDHLAASCAEGGRPEHVDVIVQRSSSPDDTRRQLAIALARAGRCDEALSIAGNNSSTLADVALALAESNQFERARQLLDSLLDHKDTVYKRVTALALIARCSADPTTSRSALDEAKSLIDAAPSPIIRSMAMAEVARAEAHCGVSTAAARFAQAIKTAHEKDDSRFWSFLGPSPRNSALTLVGQRMIEAGLLEQAFGLIQELEKETEDEWLALRASLLGTIAVREARLGTLDKHRVEALFAQALAIARRIPTAMLGPPWQLIALAQIAKQLAESGRYRSAFNTISLAHFTLDPFMIGVSEWADTLEELEKGMSLAVIAAMTRIFGWQRADWKILAEQLA